MLARKTDFSKIFNIKEVQSKFELQESDKLISSYVCAIQSKIMLFGRLFIYRKKICFHSSYNYTNLFGDTTYKVDISEVKELVQENEWIIIKTDSSNNEELRLTQFMFFRSAFDTLKLLIDKKGIADQSTEMDNKKEGNAFQSLNLNGNLQNSYDQNAIKIQQRKQRIQAQMIPQQNFKYQVKCVIPNMTARELFYTIFRDSPVTLKGKQYESASHCYLIDFAGEKEVKIENWDREPPKIYQELFCDDFKEFSEFPSYISKKRQFIHEQNTKIPMIGSIKANVKVEDRCFFLDDKNFAIECTTQVTGAPFADNFLMKGLYNVTQLPNNQVEFIQGLSLEWVKHPYIKGLIEKKFSTNNEFLFQKFKNMMIPLCQQFLENKQQLKKEYEQKHQSQAQQNHIPTNGVQSDVHASDFTTNTTTQSKKEVNITTGANSSGSYGSFRQQIFNLSQSQTSQVLHGNLRQNMDKLKNQNEELKKEVEQIKEVVVDLKKSEKDTQRLLIVSQNKYMGCGKPSKQIQKRLTEQKKRIRNLIDQQQNLQKQLEKVQKQHMTQLQQQQEQQGKELDAVFVKLEQKLTNIEQNVEYLGQKMYIEGEEEMLNERTLSLSNIQTKRNELEVNGAIVYKTIDTNKNPNNKNNNMNNNNNYIQQQSNANKLQSNKTLQSQQSAKNNPSNIQIQSQSNILGQQQQQQQPQQNINPLQTQNTLKTTERNQNGDKKDWSQLLQSQDGKSQAYTIHQDKILGLNNDNFSNLDQEFQGLRQNQIIMEEPKQQQQ